MKTFLERMNDYLVGQYPEGQGTAFSLTDRNDLPKDHKWLAQTPDIWGSRVDQVKEGENGKVIVKYIRDLIAGARNRVDVTTLAPFPDGEFLSGIQEGLVALAEQVRDTTIDVRILVGYPLGLAAQSDFLKKLVERLKAKKGRLRIYVAAQRKVIDPQGIVRSVASSVPFAGTGLLRTGFLSRITEPVYGFLSRHILGAELRPQVPPPSPLPPPAPTWNHSKIVAVDGERALVGGQNLWSQDYLKSTPVHDLNIRLEGPAVFDMHRFVNEIWKDVCAYGGSDLLPTFDWRPAYWETGREIETGCLPDINVGQTKPTGRGNMKVMGVGRYGNLKSPKMNPTDDAFIWAFDQAKDEIYLSQQDLLGPLRIGTWGPGINAIVNAIKRKCHVYIVVSNHGAGPYSNTWDSSPKVTYKAVADHPSSKDVALKDYLHVASLRFGPAGDVWKGGKEFANHAKFVMVDNQAFYVGSCNLYPSDLIEYGVFLEDGGAIAYVKKNYWDPLWEFSQRTLYRP